MSNIVIHNIYQLYIPTVTVARFILQTEEVSLLNQAEGELDLTNKTQIS
jgi:hypothetical protein